MQPCIAAAACAAQRAHERCIGTKFTRSRSSPNTEPTSRYVAHHRSVAQSISTTSIQTLTHHSCRIQAPGMQERITRKHQSAHRENPNHPPRNLKQPVATNQRTRKHPCHVIMMPCLPNFHSKTLTNTSAPTAAQNAHTLPPHTLGI